MGSHKGLRHEEKPLWQHWRLNSCIASRDAQRRMAKQRNLSKSFYWARYEPRDDRIRRWVSFLNCAIYYVSLSNFKLTGTLGVVTEVTIKIRPVPPVRKYASFVFPDFDCGVKFMWQVARDVSRYLIFMFFGHFLNSYFPPNSAVSRLPCV